MQRPPRRPAEPMLGGAEWRLIAGTAPLEAAVTLGAFLWTLETRGLHAARSLTFSVLVFSELFRAFAARSRTRIFWEVGAFTNLRLVGVVALQVLLQLSIQHFPATQLLFRVGGLSVQDSALALSLGLVPVSVLESWKLLRRAVRAARP